MEENTGNMDGRSLYDLVRVAADEQGWALVDKKLEEIEQQVASMDSDAKDSDDSLQITDLRTVPPASVLKRLLTLLPNPGYFVTVADICWEMYDHPTREPIYTIDHIKAICEVQPALALEAHVYQEFERHERVESCLMLVCASLRYYRNANTREMLDCALYLATVCPRLLLMESTGDVQIRLPMEQLVYCFCSLDEDEGIMHLVKEYLFPLHSLYCAELGIGDRDHALVRLLSDLRGSDLLDSMLENQTILRETYTHNVAGVWKLVLSSTTLGDSPSVLKALLIIDRSNGTCCVEHFGVPAFGLAGTKNRSLDTIHLLLQSNADFLVQGPKIVAQSNDRKKRAIELSQNDLAEPTKRKSGK
jgi:hypothetical protein